MRGDAAPVSTSLGDPVEVTELFRREHGAMVRLATLLVGSSEQAEEVVQDAFETVDQRWSQIEQPGAYLRQVVVNGCRGVLRRRDIERRHQQLAIVDELEHLPTHLIELHDALAKLSERQRTVIVLRYFVDLPDEEIAEILDCRPPTVRSLARRGLRLLRKELQ